MNRELYSPELHYWFDMPDFDFEKAALVTVQTVAQFCRYYEAATVVPLDGKRDVKRSGELPEDVAERGVVSAEILNWLWQNSDSTDLFTLFMHDEPLDKKEGVAICDHHDDTCCWVLNLTTAQFSVLQKAWAKNHLPTDLFFTGEMICEPVKNKIGKFLGFQKCYTPKQYEAQQSLTKNRN